MTETGDEGTLGGREDRFSLHEDLRCRIRSSTISTDDIDFADIVAELRLLRRVFATTG